MNPVILLRKNYSKRSISVKNEDKSIFEKISFFHPHLLLFVNLDWEFNIHWFLTSFLLAFTIGYCIIHYRTLNIFPTAFIAPRFSLSFLKCCSKSWNTVFRTLLLTSFFGHFFEILLIISNTVTLLRSRVTLLHIRIKIASKT